MIESEITQLDNGFWSVVLYDEHGGRHLHLGIPDHETAVQLAFDAIMMDSMTLEDDEIAELLS